MATLAALPIELVERVVNLLTIEEIGELRLVSRELRAKASQGSYLSYFISHNVDLNETSLRTLASILEEDNLSRRLRHLTITALVYDDHGDKSPISPFSPDWDPPLLSSRPKNFCTSEAKGMAALQERREERQRQAKINLRRAQHEVNVECDIYRALVQHAFMNIKLYCKDGILETLRMGCRVDAGNGPRLELSDKDARFNYLSAHTAYLFSITMDGLLTSRLTVHNLDIFSRTRHCSLACTQLSPYLAHTNRNTLQSVTASVKTLAMSFSRLTESETQRTRDMCCTCNKRKTRQTGDKMTCHKHLAFFDDEDDIYCQSESSLTAFLKLFTNVQELDIRQYEIERSGDKWNPIAFDEVSEKVRLPGLQKLTLRGVNADEKSLLLFVSAHKQLQSLDIRHVNLKDGQWQAIFTMIRTAMPQLNKLTLEDLFENKRADTVTVPSTTGQFIHVPPPPPPILHFGAGVVPPPPPAATSQADTFLNTLLNFRVMNVPTEVYTSAGHFKNNKITINGPSIAKADILYGFVSHAVDKWKIEKKWMAEQTREYGPLPRDVFSLDY